jgi:hypothetical protein
LKVKGLREPESQQQNQPQSLPSITQKGGSIIMQNWSTKQKPPEDLPNLDLPIIVNKNKIQDLIAAENQQDKELKAFEKL